MLYPLWPAVAITILTAAGFAIFKFSLLAEIALDIDTAKATLPFEFLRVFVETRPSIDLKEAVMQGLAAIFTMGLLTGYILNAPLAEAWRCSALFGLSCLGMAIVSILGMPWVLNPWVAAYLMGGVYGTACAARGKTVPLLALGNGRHNALINGIINGCLVIGLLAGSILGGVLSSWFIGDTATPLVGRLYDADWLPHVILMVMLVIGTLIGRRLHVPEPEKKSFGQAFSHILSSTGTLSVRYWSLLISGGIAWGISTALGLAMVFYMVDDLHMHYDTATTLSIFGAFGAILGSWVSDWFARRRWVVSCYFILAGIIFIIPRVVVGYWSAVPVIVLFGIFFMIPTNVVDARFLALSARDGMAGYGGSVISLLHNVFILLISTGLAVPLFLQYIKAEQQFLLLAAAACLAAVFAGIARLSDKNAGEA